MNREYIFSSVFFLKDRYAHDRVWFQGHVAIIAQVVVMYWSFVKLDYTLVIREALHTHTFIQAPNVLFVTNPHISYPTCSIEMRIPPPYYIHPVTLLTLHTIYKHVNTTHLPPVSIPPYTHDNSPQKPLSENNNNYDIEALLLYRCLYYTIHVPCPSTKFEIKKKKKKRKRILCNRAKN